VVFRAFAVFAVWASLTLPLSAATISVVQHSQQAWRGLNEPEFLECGISLSGPIEAGDTERLRSALSGANIVPVLCLNSEGGLFSEGLRLAQFIRETQLVTLVQAGDVCHSACAMAFMGGSYSELGTAVQRYMHPTASVGFHAPELDLPDGMSPNVIVETAYRDALSDISRTLLTLVLATDTLGEPYFSPYLLAEMLATPSDELRFVETINDSALWGIEILFFPRSFDHAWFAPIGCLNAVYWAWDETPPEDYGAELGNTVIEQTPGGLHMRVFPDGEFETTCTWNESSPGSLSVEGMRSARFFSPTAVFLLPGATALRDLVE